MSRCDCQWGSRARARRSGLLWQPAACGPWSGPAIVWGMIASPNGRVRFHPMEVSTARAACHPAPGSPPSSELEARGGGRLSRGLRYASGMSWLGAGACVSDGVLIAVITRGRHKYPGETVWSSWTIECPQCSREYTLKDSPGECFRCGQSRCPRCGACDCPRKVRPICRECFTELSASEASNGRTLCGQCE